MKTIEIKGVERKDTGKKATKKLRKDNQVPCVIYGGEKNVHFNASSGSFRGLIFTPNSYIINLDIDGKSYLAVLKDIQFHPVTDEILHIDFLQVFEDRKINIGVPIQLHGFAVGVQSGGKLQTESRKLTVRALIKDLPDILDVEITDLALGKSIKVRDLSFEGIELVDPANTVVCSVKLTRMAVSEVGKEDEEGEEGEGTEEGTEEGAEVKTEE